MLQACLSGCCICFQTYDASVLSECCVCLQWFQVFLQVFQTHVSNVLFVFRRMLQLLHLHVSKTRSSVTSPSSSFFCCIASVAGVGRQRQPPLARVPPTCLWTGAEGKTWVDKRGTWDMGQRRLASGHPDASHADLYTYMCFSWSMSQY
jgi:hypothetical protein